MNIQNEFQIRPNITQNHIKMSLGVHLVNMELSGVLFGTLRLRLDTLWCVLGAFLVSLVITLDTLGSILGRLGHSNFNQNDTWIPKVACSRFSSHLKRHFLGFLYSCTFLNCFLKWCSWILR